MLILGERDHPEVLALRSYAGEDSLVVETAPRTCPAELPSARVGVVVQTTQSQERLAELVAHLAPRTRELLVYNTICSATEQRKQRPSPWPDEVDVVIVVGGGTRQHPEAGRALRRCPAPHIPRESPRRNRARLVRATSARVGITAGASTPPDQIEAVVQRWIREIDTMTKRRHHALPEWPSSAIPTWVSPRSSTGSPALARQWSLPNRA